MLALVKGRVGRLAAQAAVLAVVVGASVIYSTVDKNVTLSVDGKTSHVHVFAKTVSSLLADQGIKVGARDIVAPSPSTKLGDGDTVVVRYARPLTLTINGTKQVYWTTELSVDSALAALGVRADGALMSASRSQPIGRSGLAFWLSTPKQVTLIADGTKQQLTTSVPTVSALLAQEHIVVAPLDRLSVVPSEFLTDGLVVKLTRIVEKRMTKTETVSYSVTKKSSSSLYKGSTKVITKGKLGSRSAVYDLITADGKVQKQTLVTATVLTKPVAEVVEVGTKAKPVSTSSSGSGGSVGGSVGSLNWTALAKCESGNNPRAVNAAGYYGLYQFSLATWHAQGGSGNPIDASSSEQTTRAEILYQKTGASSWPSCGPKLFT